MKERPLDNHDLDAARSLATALRDVPPAVMAAVAESHRDAAAASCAAAGEYLLHGLDALPSDATSSDLTAIQSQAFAMMTPEASEAYVLCLDGLGDMFDQLTDQLADSFQNLGANIGFGPGEGVLMMAASTLADALARVPDNLMERVPFDQRAAARESCRSAGEVLNRDLGSVDVTFATPVPDQIRDALSRAKLLLTEEALEAFFEAIEEFEDLLIKKAPATARGC